MNLKCSSCDEQFDSLVAFDAHIYLGACPPTRDGVSRHPIRVDATQTRRSARPRKTEAVRGSKVIETDQVPERETR